MCWNKDVSINTFIFACFALGFIYFANTYTKYKIEYFQEHSFYYVFMFSFVVMQLIEYYLWISIETKNTKLNYWFSILGFITILLQPIFALLLITKHINLRNALLLLYLLNISIYLLYSYFFNPIEFITTRGKNNNLKWNWLFIDYTTIIVLIIWFLCFFIGFSLEDSNIINVSMILCLALFFIYTNGKTQEWGSLWCFFVNISLFYFLIHILFYQPFLEYKNICGF